MPIHRPTSCTFLQRISRFPCQKGSLRGSSAWPDASGERIGSMAQSIVLSDGARALAIAALALASVCGLLVWRALRLAPGGPDRLVVELRLAQLAAAVLILMAGASIGFAVMLEDRPGVGWEIAVALGFFFVAATAALRDPHEALTLLAVAFVAHALLHVLPRPVWWQPLAPRWYVVSAAVYSLVMGALCYLPMLRR